MSTGKPEIDFPGGEPPAELQITEIWEGDGSVAKPGDTVQVHYVGVAFSTGEEFDASWDRASHWSSGSAPTGHRGLGSGRAGHEGRRPPPADHPPGPGLRRPGRRDVIAPGETLIFVCDLVRVDEHRSARRAPASRSSARDGSRVRAARYPAGSR